MIAPQGKSIKNICEGCTKFILLHNRIMTCLSCGMIVHSQCAKNLFQYDHLGCRWLCYKCTSATALKYNPFSTISYDRHDPVNIAEFEDVAEISKILEDCQSYDMTNFKNFVNSNRREGKNLSMLFNNIDGNASNFDSFVSEISQYRHAFSFIGIAETNINEVDKDLYKIPGYNSEYNDKIPGKIKGSGIALYIQENFTYSRIDFLCQCTPNLESLFVSITNAESLHTIGVLYRPPSGVESEALAEFDEISR